MDWACREGSGSHPVWRDLERPLEETSVPSRTTDTQDDWLEEAG